MNLSELAVLRTKLRALNIEYSALVRGKTEEGAFVRMQKLRAERRALMALIAEQRLEDREYHAAVGSLAGALLAGSEIDAAGAGGATVGSAGCSIDVQPVSASGSDVLSM